MRHVAAHGLQHGEIRHAGGELEIGGVGYRAAGVVRADGQVASLGLAAIFLTSMMPPTWLTSGWAKSAQRSVKKRWSSQRLYSRSPAAMGTRLRCLTSSQGFQVVRRDGLFEPVDVVPFQLASDAHGGGDIEPPVAFDQDVHLIATAASTASMLSKASCRPPCRFPDRRSRTGPT